MTEVKAESCGQGSPKKKKKPGSKCKKHFRIIGTKFKSKQTDRNIFANKKQYWTMSRTKMRA